MDLLDHFRKKAGPGWVCKREVRLLLDNGRRARLRAGQSIYTGDFRYQGMDLATALDILPGSQDDRLRDGPHGLAAG